MLKIDPLQEFDIIGEDLYSYILTRDNNLCQLCGKGGTEIHHIEARGHGGKNFARNLILLCRICHTGHGGIHGTLGGSVKELLKERVIKNEEKLKEKLI